MKGLKYNLLFKACQLFLPDNCPDGGTEAPD